MPGNAWLPSHRNCHIKEQRPFIKQRPMGRRTWHATVYKKLRNCKLQHALEKQNIMWGRAVKLQFVLTASRPKTSATL